MHSILLHHAVTGDRDRTLRQAERFGPLLVNGRTARRRRRSSTGTAATASMGDRAVDQR